MKKKMTYKAKGMVLGNYWGGGSGAYSTILFETDSKEELLEKANKSLNDGSIDSGMGLSITIDKFRVFINKTLSTQSLINQLLIKRVGLSISVDSR